MKLFVLFLVLCLCLTGCASPASDDAASASADPLATLAPTRSAAPTPTPTATPVPTLTPSGESHVYVHGQLAAVTARTGDNGMLYLPLEAVCDYLPGVNISTDEAGVTWLISTAQAHITLRLEEDEAIIAVGAQPISVDENDVLSHEGTLYLSYSLMGALLGTQVTQNPAGDILIALPTPEPTPEPTATEAGEEE